MFSKSDKATSRIETVVGPGTELEGNIRVSESMRIDGKIKGEIQADSVIIGELGVVWATSGQHRDRGRKSKRQYFRQLRSSTALARPNSGRHSLQQTRYQRRRQL